MRNFGGRSVNTILSFKHLEKSHFKCDSENIKQNHEFNLGSEEIYGFFFLVLQEIKFQLKTLVCLASNWEKCVDMYSSKSVILYKFSHS
jgi:hypothetical protein